MAGIVADLEIDYTAALAGADDVGQQLASALDTAAQLGAESLQAALESVASAAPIDVSVDADTTPATAAMSDLVGAIEADTPSITVDADTTEATAALDDLDSSAQSASASLSGASGDAKTMGLSTGQLAGVAGLAVGEVGSLREASSLLGERTAVATAGVLGLGVGIGELYHQGLNAVSAEQRFTAALGDQADAVQRVKVGNLDDDLLHLGVTFGSADAAMRNATSSVFQFAVNSGASRKEATQFADGIAAISARAVATKPDVGTMSDVMDRAAIGIGRARTAASLLNVGLSTTEVNTRAAAIAMSKGEESASAYDKSVAALQIAVERFGPSLKQNVEEGAKNAANQAKAAKAEFDNALESFGKPLVAPGLELIHDAIPVAEQFGKALSDVASVALPVLSAALKVLGPLIEPVVIGLLAVKAISIGSSLAVELGQLASAWGLLGQEAATSAAEQGAAIFSTEVSLGTLSSVAIPGAIAGFVAFKGTTAILHSVFDEVDLIGPALDDVTAAAKRTAAASDGDLAPSFDRLLTKVEHLRTVSNETLTPDDSFLSFKPKTVDAAASSIENLESTLQAFRAVAEASLPAAAKLADQTDHGSAAYRGMVQILGEVSGKQHEAKAATDDLAGSQAGQNELWKTAITSMVAFHDGAGSATQALKDLNAAQQNENDAITLYNDQLTRTQALQGDVTSAQIALGNATEKLNESLFQNGANFDINTQAGRDNVSALQAQLQSADQLAEATFKSEQATLGDTQARTDADNVLQFFKGTLDNTLTSLGLNTDQVNALNTQLGLVTSPPPVVLTVDASQAFAALKPILSGLDAVFAASDNPLAFSIPGDFTPPPAAAEGAYVKAQRGGSRYLIGEAGSDEVVVSPRNISGAVADLQRLGVLDQLVARAPVSTPTTSTPQTSAANRGGPTIEQTLIFQQPTNPTEAVRIQHKALGRAASMAKL